MATRIVRQLSHVCIFARDVEETARFYQDVLNLEIKFRFTRKGDWFGFYLDLGGQTNIEVFRKPEAEWSDTDRINHLCIEVVDMKAAVAHIRSKGVEVTGEKLGIDGTWQAWIRDPNNTRIELFQLTEKSMQFLGGTVEANW